MDNLIEKSCLFIINTLYYQTIFCAILFIFIFGLTYFLRGKSPRLLLGLWFLILIRLLLPTDLSFSLSARNLFANFPIMENLNVSVEKVSDKLSIYQHPNQNPASNVFRSAEDQRSNREITEWDLKKGRSKMISWPIFLTIAWLFGCLITLILFLNRFRCINRVLDHSSLVREKGITAYVNYWYLSFKIKRPVTIFSSDEFLSPFTVGLFRPKIFIPKPLLETSDNETINAIIAHEMVHIKRFDYVWIKFQNVLQIIYFFNPVVWYANRQISMARERICDSIVLAKRVIPPKEYGKGVIDVLKFNLFGYRLIDPLLCFSNHKKIFEHRINGIIKQSAMTKQKTLLVLLMVCLLGLFLLPMSKIKGITPAKDILLKDIYKDYINMVGENLNNLFFNNYILPALSQYGQINLANEGQQKQLAQVIKFAIRDSNIELVNIYSIEEDMIVYSTDPKFIREKVIETPEYKKAVNGEKSSVVISEEKDHWGFGIGKIGDVEKIRAYIPITIFLNTSGEEFVIGVFEVILDITNW